MHKISEYMENNRAQMSVGLLKLLSSMVCVSPTVITTPVPRDEKTPDMTMILSEIFSHATNEKPVPIQAFLDYVVSCNVTPSVFPIVASYLERIRNCIQVHSRNCDQLLFIAMSLAIKYCEDLVSIKGVVKRFWTLQPRLVSELELVFLGPKMLNWSLEISDQQLIYQSMQLSTFWFQYIPEFQMDHFLQDAPRKVQTPESVKSPTILMKDVNTPSIKSSSGKQSKESATPMQQSVLESKYFLKTQAPYASETTMDTSELESRPESRLSDASQESELDQYRCEESFLPDVVTPDNTNVQIYQPTFAPYFGQFGYPPHPSCLSGPYHPCFPPSMMPPTPASSAPAQSYPVINTRQRHTHNSAFVFAPPPSQFPPMRMKPHFQIISCHAMAPMMPMPVHNSTYSVQFKK